MATKQKHDVVLIRVGPRPVYDWTTATEKEIAYAGWPEGTDGATANFLQAKVKEALTLKPMRMDELYYYTKSLDGAPEKWRNASVISWRYQVIEAACRFVDRLHGYPWGASRK